MKFLFLVLILFLLSNKVIYSQGKELSSHEILAKVSFEEGYKAYFKGLLDIAIIRFEEAVKYSPLNGEYYFYLGKAYFKINDFKKAISALSRCVELAPKLKDAYFYLGNAYYKNNELEKAKQTFKKLIELQPTSFEGYFMLGKICIETAEVDMGILYLEKASKINSEEPQLFFFLGKAHLHQGNYLKSILYSNKAISLESNNAAFYFLRGNAYFAHKDYLSEDDTNWHSVKDYYKAIEFGLDTVEVHFMYGNSLLYRALYYIKTDRKGLALDFLEKAIVAYKKVIYLNPSASNAYNNLGLCYYFLDRLDEAIEVYKKAIDLEPTVAFFHDNLAEAYYKKAEFENALFEWNLVLELDPNYVAGDLDGLLPYFLPVKEKIKNTKRRITR